MSTTDLGRVRETYARGNDVDRCQVCGLLQEPGTLARRCAIYEEPVPHPASPRRRKAYEKARDRHGLAPGELFVVRQDERRPYHLPGRLPSENAFYKRALKSNPSQNRNTGHAAPNRQVRLEVMVHVRSKI
jgi:hypothetical protein